MILDDVRKIAIENTDNLLRVCIGSVGSPIWYSETFADDILKFIAQLKSITRFNGKIVCLVTTPLHLIDLIDDQLMFKIRKLVDANVNLESFDNVDKQTNAVFKQYHGLIHIKKLQTLTALQSHKPESFDLAFKLKSHRFVIEKLHLPPELQDNDAPQGPSMSCATTGGGNKALDFWRRGKIKKIFLYTRNIWLSGWFGVVHASSAITLIRKVFCKFSYDKTWTLITKSNISIAYQITNQSKLKLTQINSNIHSNLIFIHPRHRCAIPLAYVSRRSRYPFYSSTLPLDSNKFFIWRLSFAVRES